MAERSDYDRDVQLQRLAADGGPWDVVVIGGGATGVGIAADAASRGYHTALFESHDFGKGTSSRSTKLIHGGLRYLQQGNIHLVREALRERGLLCRNAPHLVHPLPTLVPCRSHWEKFYYGVGLKAYDLLAGRLNLGKSRRLSTAESLERIPTLATKHLRGGILYLDGAFDDARLLINLVQTAIDCGAVCVNYAPVRALMKEGSRVAGVIAVDEETGNELRVAARVVINAGGPFSDDVQRLDAPQAEPMIAPSQGIHLVFDRAFLPSDTAIIVPRTPDGRVIFAIPWHGHTVIGTTDTLLPAATFEPRAQPAEIEFLLETIAPYLAKPPARSDIRAIFAGIRPLVRASKTKKTSKLGRDHVIEVSRSGLISIIGGKWTTYRKMAEDCVDRATLVAGLLPNLCQTTSMPIRGGIHENPTDPLSSYGSDATALHELINSKPAWQTPLEPRLPYVTGQVIWAARQEMARTVEDVLGRRLRALFLNAEAATASAPRVAELLAAELGRNAKWQTEQLAQFQEIAAAYRPPAS
jgi:glycerol-3-phosphate dehydrogenase